MADISIKRIINTSFFTAFTFAAALIWRDFFVEFLSILLPNNNELFFKLITAILATLLVIMSMYFLYKTENSAKKIYTKFRKNMSNSNKKFNKEKFKKSYLQ